MKEVKDKLNKAASKHNKNAVEKLQKEYEDVKKEVREWAFMKLLTQFLTL